MKNHFFYIFLSPIFFFTTEIFGQKKTFEVGGKLINELTFYNGFAPGIGAQVIYRMSNKSGIESGLYYKIRPISFHSFPPNSTTFYQVEVSERNLLFPVLYRFDSRYVNFTIGPVLEYFLGWKFRPHQSEVVIKDYITESFELIATASISKKFNLKNNWIIEPEFRFSAFVPNGDGGYGLNLSFRKKLN